MLRNDDGFTAGVNLIDQAQALGLEFGCGLPIAIGGIWMWFYFRDLNSMPLLSVNDPDAREVLEPAHE
jgi:hypothetical protein